jgi:hypothetical protein
LSGYSRRLPALSKIDDALLAPLVAEDAYLPGN